MNLHTDALIDQTLQALRDTEVPVGLEARIAARIAQAAEARTTAAPSFFAVILNAVKEPRIFFAEPPLYTWATIAFILVVAAVSTFVFHRHEQTTAQWIPTQNEPAHSSTLTQASPVANTEAFTQASKRDTRAPKGFSLGSHSSSQTAGVSIPAAVDLDAIALAETLAPSHPAPPMPLTAQEVLLFRATRQGQPIELAELDAVRDINLRSIAQARERATLRRYIQSLLAPLAAAQALNPESPDDTQPVTAPDPPSSK